LGSCVLRASFVFFIVILVAIINISSMNIFIDEDNLLSSKARSLYSRFGEDACFLTISSHGPSYQEYWPGRQCPMVSLLSALDDLESRDRKFESAVRTCFCDSSVVMTDNVTTEERENLYKRLRYFQYHNDRLIEDILWSRERGETVFSHFRMKLRSYSREARLEICKNLSL